MQTVLITSNQDSLLWYRQTWKCVYCSITCQFHSVQFSYYPHTQQFSCQTPQWLGAYILQEDITSNSPELWNREISIKLGKICCSTISPWWVIYNFSPTERACLLSVKPSSNACFTEDVTTMEENWSFIFIVADWALTASCLYLVFVWAHTKIL